MKFFYTFFLLVLCALCQSCWIDESSKKGQENRGKRELPTQNDGNDTGIDLPIATESESIALIFEMNSDNTVLTVRTEDPNGRLFVSSKTTGTIFTKQEGHVGITSADLGDGLTLNFDLSPGSFIQKEDGQSVQPGDPIAETKNVVRFYIEDYGQKAPFCVNKNNITNRAPEYVTLKILEPETPCQ